MAKKSKKAAPGAVKASQGDGTAANAATIPPKASAAPVAAKPTPAVAPATAPATPAAAAHAAPTAVPASAPKAAAAPAPKAAPKSEPKAAPSTEAVAARAHQIWIARGKPVPGTPLEDWLHAERDLGMHKS